jgi:glycosyltransferase involved in cell wall biosynthesis
MRKKLRSWEILAYRLGQADRGERRKFFVSYRLFPHQVVVPGARSYAFLFSKPVFRAMSVVCSAASAPLPTGGIQPQADALELSVVLPCLNEARTLGACVEKIQATLARHNIRGEVVVADNGSTDRSMVIAENKGARVTHVEAKGYGNALMGGIAAAGGKYIVIGDCDDTYDFSHIPRFLEKLREGYDLVMGNRFAGGIRPGAMPLLHRYIGNPLLSLVGRMFFHSRCHDFHCGLRGFSKESYYRLGMRTTGMEFASEMVVKAVLIGLRVCEVPTTLSRDGRERRPHLRTWRDGWRHLRFMLLYSPRWLFLYPGLLMMLAGLLSSLWLLPQPRIIHGITFDVHTLLYAMVAILIGFQAVAFAVFAKVYGMTEGLLPEDPRAQRLLQIVTLEAGLACGCLLTLAGMSSSIYAVHIWSRHGFGPLKTSIMLRTVVPSVTAMTLGCQIVLFSFFLSVLGLARK